MWSIPSLLAKYQNCPSGFPSREYIGEDQVLKCAHQSRKGLESPVAKLVTSYFLQHFFYAIKGESILLDVFCASCTFRMFDSHFLLFFFAGMIHVKRKQFLWLLWSRFVGLRERLTSLKIHFNCYPGRFIACNMPRRICTKEKRPKINYFKS